MIILRTEIKEKVQLGVDGFAKIQAVTQQTLNLVSVSDAQQTSSRLQNPTTMEDTSYQFSIEQQKSQMKGQMQLGKPLNHHQAHQQAQQPQQQQASRDRTQQNEDSDEDMREYHFFLN